MFIASGLLCIHIPTSPVKMPVAAVVTRSDVTDDFCPPAVHFLSLHPIYF